MRTIQGSVRYCDRCTVIKPDRAHHCSVCGSCVLKMDHHCPWVNNCVAFNNYKFFILFLFYGFFYCVYVALSSFKYFLEFWATTFDAPGNTNYYTQTGKSLIEYILYVIMILIPFYTNNDINSGKNSPNLYVISAVVGGHCIVELTTFSSAPQILF